MSGERANVRRMRLTAAALALTLLAACGLSIDEAGTSKPRRVVQTTPAPPSASPQPQPSQTPREQPFEPAPNRRIPRHAGRLAEDLVRVSRALAQSVPTWRRMHPTRNARPSRRVVLQSLYQQRIYRLLTRRSELARRVLRRLPKGIRLQAHRNIKAGTNLRSLTRPVKPPVRMKTQRPEPPGALLGYYKKAQRRFDVDWEVLAAVNSIETRFGRIRSASYAGAQGPMQFIPSTWRAYGMGGDVHDPHDAILGAANYLSASGAPRDYRRALYAYNNATEYVTAVLSYAREIMRRARNYYVYYSWQVFVRTTKGDMQLTGPGKDRR
jgi:hypothetical protein